MAFNNSKTVLAADNGLSNNTSDTNKVITIMSSDFYHGEPTIEEGDEGYYVTNLQRKLTDLGYTEVGGVDGILGPNTKLAVMRFQGHYGLDVDGIVGPKTWTKLNEIHWNWRNSYPE